MQVSFTFVHFVFQWNLVCDRDYVKSLIMTFQMVGVLIGAVIVGQLADMYGRRNVYFAVYTLLLIVSFGSSFASSWQLYAACRAIIGALIGGTRPFCLLLECSTWCHASSFVFKTFLIFCLTFSLCIMLICDD